MKIIVNPDDSIVKEIRQKLKENDGYCPCSLIKNNETKCPCVAFRQQESGECHCGLYIKIKE